MAKKNPLFEYEGIIRGEKPSIKRPGEKHEGWMHGILPADVAAGPVETDPDRRPILWLAGFVMLAVMILVYRLFSLQIVGGSRNLGLAEGNRIRQKINRAARGVIYDRFGKVLVRNLASFDVSVTPRLLPQNASKRRAIYEGISSYVSLDANQIATQAEAKGLAQFQPQLIVSGLEREKALQLDEKIEQFSGFHLDVNPIREYQESNNLSHILGYIGRISETELKDRPQYLATDYIGKLGLERQYEDILKGANGTEQIEVDALGQPIKILASKPAVAGSNLILSVDKELESKLAEAITRQMEASGSSRSAGVALNPKTGEVLASVSLPSYDPNLFSKGISQKEYARLLADKAQPLFNKAIDGAYPTGSIIKPLVASAALQERVVTPQTTINDTGELKVPNQYDSSVVYTFRSWEAGGLGVVNLTRALAVSSNIYFYTVGGGFGNIAGLGINRLADYYQKFGLGEKTGIDLPSEATGRVPTPDWKKRVKKEAWFTGDTYNVSVGQGDILASPLQMAVATSAIANGGKVMKPQLLKKVTDLDGNTVKQVREEVVRENFISPEHLALVRGGMREVVASGTACCQFDQQVSAQVAGKTGSAETDPGNRKPHAWFTAFAPYQDPEIVMVVLIETSGEGSRYAAPAVRETLSWYFSREKRQ